MMNYHTSIVIIFKNNGLPIIGAWIRDEI